MARVAPRRHRPEDPAGPSRTGCPGTCGSDCHGRLPRDPARPGSGGDLNVSHPATQQILNVRIGDEFKDSAAETIGVTANHPFWSVEHNAFIPIGSLKPGSHVLTQAGQIKRIVSILPRPGPGERVYNFEVLGEHVYYVGKQRTLVHNEYGHATVYISKNRDHVAISVTTKDTKVTKTTHLYRDRADIKFGKVEDATDYVEKISKLKNSQDHVVFIDLSDATKAISKQDELLQATPKHFKSGTNSCVSHIKDVLKAGGVKVDNLADTIADGFWDDLLKLAGQ